MVKSDKIQYSFITAAYNCLDLTRSFLRSFEQTVGLAVDSFEIILIDDCSTEPIESLVAAFPKLPIRYIRNEANKGFGESNNRGARVAQGDILILLNNDLTLLPGWLEPMLKELRSDASIGAVGNIQVNPKSKLMDHAGVAFDLEGIPFHARKNRRLAKDVESYEWPAITAACMGIRRSVFLEMGGFSDAYRNGAEDIDLCLALKKAGYRNVVCNGSVIHHHVSSSPGRHDFNEQNLNVLKERWGPESALIGRKIWASEYLHRYARHWWKFSPSKLIRALFMVCRTRS